MLHIINNLAISLVLTILWGISPRNLTLFTRLFLTRRRVQVEYKTNFSPRPSQALDSLQYSFCSLVPRLLRSVFWWCHAYVEKIPGSPCMYNLISCPAPPRTCEKEGLVFWTTFLVTWGGVAPRSEGLNQILERIIICAWHKQAFVHHTVRQSKSS